MNYDIEQLFTSIICKGDLFSHNPIWQHYHGLNGTEELLKEVADLLTEKLAGVSTKLIF